MSLALKHDWPERVRDKTIPASARVLTGSLLVPAHLPAGVLAYVEQEFRNVLWPPAQKDGYRRYSREFAWESGGRILHYRIVDLPCRDGRPD